MKKIAIIGTVGVPARYGGFETLVENIIGDNCSDGFEYTVYCSSKKYDQKLFEYKKAKLRYIPFNANGAQSILYDIVAILRSLRESDVLLILGVSGCVILPLVRLFSRKKIIINIDGLEHRRDKWDLKTRNFLKFSEKLAVRNATVVVSDNKVIQDYVQNEYGIKSELIAYGGDHVQCDISNIEVDIMQRYSIIPQGFSFSLCRIEPENNVHITLEAFARNSKKLLFVGNWNNSDYGKSLLEKYKKYDNIKMLSPIYDIMTLNVLRSNCIFYLHGHSAGGTNPSLVEAMFFGKPILAFDCLYNRETTENKANYFADSKELENLINQEYLYFVDNAYAMREIAQKRYTWAKVAKQYEQLY